LKRQDYPNTLRRLRCWLLRRGEQNQSNGCFPDRVTVVPRRSKTRLRCIWSRAARAMLFMKWSGTPQKKRTGVALPWCYSNRIKHLIY